MPSKHHFASTKIMEVIKKTSEIHNKTGALILENGEVLWGYGLGSKKSVVGELCFNTSQTGYQEALTDPSYTKQIITYESNDKISLVNLSERLRLEVRETWKNKDPEVINDSSSFLLVIDNQTSNYQHWKGLKEEKLGSYGIYQIWRIQKKILQERELSLRDEGVLANWKLPRDERL